MRSDVSVGRDTGLVAAVLRHSDHATWRAAWKLEKRRGDDLSVAPFEVIHGEGNLLMYGGISTLWECLLGNGTGTSAQTLSYFSSSNAYIGVGDSTTTEAATQTDLAASSNKLRRSATASHSDATTSGAASASWVATFGTSDANFHWQEWGLFNGATGGRMMNRKVIDLGTKTSAASWSFTVTITLS